MVRPAVLALLLLTACAGTEAAGPDGDATLEVVGYRGPIEIEFSQTFRAVWRDSRGTSPAMGVVWSSSNQGVAGVSQTGVVTGVAPGSAIVRAEAGGRSAGVALEILPLTHYTPQELAVFNTLVFSGNGARRLRKWADDIRIQVSGVPSAEDREALDAVAVELAATLRTIPVSLVEFGGNVQLAFVPDTLYRSMAGGTCAPPAFVWGFSCPTADSASRLVQTVVFISSTRSAEIRRYLIRHELMHMAGFYDHPSGVPSILNRPEQITLDHYLPLDFGLLEMMGRAELVPGMYGSEAMLVLAGLSRLLPPNLRQ
jgi:hypothetical protein